MPGRVEEQFRRLIQDGAVEAGLEDGILQTSSSRCEMGPREDKDTQETKLQVPPQSLHPLGSQSISSGARRPSHSLPLPDGACLEEQIELKYPVLLSRDKPGGDIFDDEISGSLETTFLRKTTFLNGVASDATSMVRLVFNDDKRKSRTIDVPYDDLRTVFAAVCNTVTQLRPRRKTAVDTSLSFPIGKKLRLWLRSPGRSYGFGTFTPALEVGFVFDALDYTVTNEGNLFRNFLAIFHAPEKPLVEDPNKVLNALNRLSRLRLN